MENEFSIDVYCVQNEKKQIEIKEKHSDQTIKTIPIPKLQNNDVYLKGVFNNTYMLLTNNDDVHYYLNLKSADLQWRTMPSHIHGSVEHIQPGKVVWINKEGIIHINTEQSKLPTLTSTIKYLKQINQ
jgi:hypothetical protein